MGSQSIGGAEKWGRIFTFHIFQRSHRCRGDSLIGAPLLMARDSNSHSNGVDQIVAESEQTFATANPSFGGSPVRSVH